MTGRTTPKRLRRGIAAALTAALVLAVPNLVAAQTGTGFATPPNFGAGGQAAVVFLGGSVDDLEAAARASGANGAWAQDAEGRFQLLVVGGPAFLRDDFAARFPAGFATATALTLTRAPGATAPPPIVTSTPVSTPAPRPTAFPGGVPGPSANQ